MSILGNHPSINYRRLIHSGITVLLLGYYIYFLQRKSIWYDESITVLMANNSPEKTLSNFKNGFDSYHSFYYLIAHFLTLPFQHSIDSIRIISTFATLVTVLGILTLCQRILTFEIGLISALIFAFTPQVIDFATEARSPALVSAVVIWTIIFLIRYLDSQSKKVFYILLLMIIASFYLSIFSLLFIPSYFLCFRLIPHKKIEIRTLLLPILCGVLSILPLFFYSLSSSNRTDWIGKNYKTINSFFHLGGLPFKESEIFELNYVPIFLLIFWCILSCNFLAILTSKRHELSNQVIIFLFSWCLAPGILLILISLLRPVYLNRYVIASLPGMLILFVTGLQLISSRLTRMAIIVSLIAISVFQSVTTNDLKNKDGWPKIVSTLKLNAEPRDSVLFDGNSRFFANALADQSSDFNLVKTIEPELNRWLGNPSDLKDLSHASKRVWVYSDSKIQTYEIDALRINGYQSVLALTIQGEEKLWLYEK